MWASLDLFQNTIPRIVAEIVGRQVAAENSIAIALKLIKDQVKHMLVEQGRCTQGFQTGNEFPRRMNLAIEPGQAR